MKRRSPVRHKVSGYTRRNGKHIEGYWRGRGTKGRQSRVVGGSIPIVTARGYVKETVEKYGGYSMTEFDKDETAFLPKNKIGLVREILEKEGFSFYPESGYGEIDSEDLERFDVVYQLKCRREKSYSDGDKFIFTLRPERNSVGMTGVGTIQWISGRV